MILLNNIYSIIHSKIFLILISFVIFDILTGIILAFETKTVNSTINKNGITKHFLIIAFVVFFNNIFIALNLSDLGKTLIYFYIGSYALSIFENLSLLGVPFPQWLQDKFLVLRDNSNKGEISDANERIKK